jgi:hypothetical protein
VDGNGDIEAAFARYVVLTGDAGASPDDPAVRRFCEAYAAALEQAAAQTAARARRLPRFRDDPAG